MRPEPEREQAVVDQRSDTRHQTYALKSGGGYARLTNDYTQRQPDGAP